MPRNGPPPDIPVDIQGLHDAYARGLDPVQVIDHVFEAIERAGDPGIFISLVERKSARKAAQKLGELMYAQAQAASGGAEGGGGQSGGAGGDGGKSDEKVVDAEFTEVKDKK